MDAAKWEWHLTHVLANLDRYVRDRDLSARGAVQRATDWRMAYSIATKDVPLP